MEYQKTINLLDDSPNQQSKFKTINWVEVNHESRGTYNEDNQIKFQTSVLRSSLCEYSDAYILVKGTIAAGEQTVTTPNNVNKNVIFKNCATFVNCISRINNVQVDDSHDIDVVISM